MIWRFGRHEDLSKEGREDVEEKAVKLISITFFILAGYVLYESVNKLYFKQPPEPSLLGIGIAVVSIIVMPVLFHMKYKTRRSIKSRSLVADSKQTLACVMLSIALLTGLGLNYLYGLWWADPGVGLVVFIFLIKEGYENYFEK